MPNKMRFLLRERGAAPTFIAANFRRRRASLRCDTALFFVGHAFLNVLSSAILTNVTAEDEPKERVPT